MRQQQVTNIPAHTATSLNKQVWIRDWLNANDSQHGTQWKDWSPPASKGFNGTHPEPTFSWILVAAGKVQKWMLMVLSSSGGTVSRSRTCCGAEKDGLGGTLTSDATLFIMFVSITTPYDVSPTPEVWGSLQQPFDFVLFTLKCNQSFPCSY